MVDEIIDPKFVLPKIKQPEEISNTYKIEVRVIRHNTDHFQLLISLNDVAIHNETLKSNANTAVMEFPIAMHHRLWTKYIVENLEHELSDAIMQTVDDGRQYAANELGGCSYKKIHKENREKRNAWRKEVHERIGIIRGRYAGTGKKVNLNAILNAMKSLDKPTQANVTELLNCEPQALTEFCKKQGYTWKKLLSMKDRLKGS